MGSRLSPANELPDGCGAFRNDELEQPGVSRVDITYYCTNCGTTATVAVRWESHHAMPEGWACRDVVPTYELPRRTDHVFSCPSAECRGALDAKYPPPSEPIWFTSS